MKTHCRMPGIENVKLRILFVIVATLLHAYLYYNNLNGHMNADPLIQIGQAKVFLDRGATSLDLPNLEDLSGESSRTNSAMWPPLYIFLLAIGFVFSSNIQLVLVVIQILICLLFFFSFDKILTELRDSIANSSAIVARLFCFFVPCIFQYWSGQVDFIAASLLAFSVSLLVKEVSSENKNHLPYLFAGIALGLSFWTRFAYWSFLSIPLGLFVGAVLTRNRLNFTRKNLLGFGTFLITSAIFIFGILMYQKFQTGVFSQIEESSHNPNTGFYPENLLKFYPFSLILFASDFSYKPISEMPSSALISALILFGFVGIYWAKFIRNFFKTKSFTPETLFILISVLITFPLLLVNIYLSLKLEEEVNGFTYVGLQRFYIPIFIFFVLAVVGGMQALWNKNKVGIAAVILSLIYLFWFRIEGSTAPIERSVLPNDEPFMLSESDPLWNVLSKTTQMDAQVVLVKIEDFSWDNRFYAMDLPYLDLFNVSEETNCWDGSFLLHTTEEIQILFAMSNSWPSSNRRKFNKWKSMFGNYNPKSLYTDYLGITYYLQVLEPN